MDGRNENGSGVASESVGSIQTDKTQHGGEMEGCTQLLLEKHIFREWISNQPSWSSLQTALSRWTTDAEKKYGISEEGANLSGLDEDDADEFIKLILSMAEDKFTDKKEREEKKEKEAKKKQAIFTHEVSQLEQQQRLDFATYEVNLETPDTGPSSGSSGSSGNKKSRYYSNNPFKWIEDLTKDEGDTSSLAAEEKRMDMELGRKKKEQDMELEAKRFSENAENDKKRLALEERRLEIDQLRLQQEMENSKRQTAMFETLLLLVKNNSKDNS